MSNPSWRAGEHFVPFYVDAELYCVWDPELATQNLHFLRAFDPDYFENLAQLVASAPEQISEQQLAITARTFYVHGLESCFALTFAGLQAPEALFAWVDRYQVPDLDSLIRKLQAGEEFKTQCRQQPKSWRDVVAFYLQRMPAFLTATDGTVVEKATVEGWLAEALGRMAEEFIAPETRSEYNAVKHGFRGVPEAATLSLSLDDPDDRVPTTAPFVLKGPQTGMRILKVTREPGRKWNLRVESHSRNWDLGQAIQRLQFCAMWMACVKAGLRGFFGDENPPIKWSWAKDADHYRDPWKPIHGTYKTRFSRGEFEIPASATKEKLAEIYDAPRKHQANTKEGAADTEAPAASPPASSSTD